MKLWIVNPYGPIHGEQWRDYRFTILGKTLAERGHDVIWWTANFSHHFKNFRSENWKDIPVTDNFLTRLVPTMAYTSNVSVKRLRFEIVYAWNMYRRARNESPPDCIISADPSQFGGYAAMRLAKRFSVPLIFDVFDAWPELFILAFPDRLRGLVPIALAPFYRLRRYNYRQADAVVSLCQTYLDIARSQLASSPQKPVMTFFNGINVAEFRSKLLTPEDALVLKNEMGKRVEDVWLVYAGSLGNNYDVMTLLGVAERLQGQLPQLKFLIAGDGPFRIRVTDAVKTRKLTNVMYLGKLKPEELIRIYSVVDAGLSAYGPFSNVAMPDKVYDYTAAGLPIINSLKGELETYIKQYEFGIQYQAGDVDSLMDAIITLVSNRFYLETLAKNSYGVATRFDQVTEYRKYVNFVENVANVHDV